MKKLIVLTVLASLGMTLVGCDATTMSAPGNHTLGSAAIGGLAGAGLGAAIDDNNRGRGALVGGLIGAGTGAAVGAAQERNRDLHQAGYVAPAPAPAVVPVPVAPAPLPPRGPVPPPHVY